MSAVLLVEDDRGVSAMLARAFRSRGWTVSSAGTPGEARALARTRSFELILSDIMLPETDGVALAEQLRALQPNAAVMFMSGYPEQYLREHIDGRGLAFLQKPFRCKVVLERATHLTASRPESALPNFDAA